MYVQPYLYFAGRCEEALAFYEAALDARRGMAIRFSESPDPVPDGVVPGDWGDKIMHCAFTVGDSEILASDGCGETPAQGAQRGFALALSVTGAEEAERRFGALAEGGQVIMPLGRTFFSPAFGMVVDRFGVAWSVVAEPDAETKLPG